MECDVTMNHVSHGNNNLQINAFITQITFFTPEI